MRSPANTPFVAIFQNEVLLNSKRVAPYALMLIFIANALLWWGRGPAGALGWATNSDFYIARNINASSTARTLLLFLVGLTVFYTGEAMHRDRELKILSVLWATPVSNNVLLLSKFLATLLLGVSLVVLVGATAIATQGLKGDTPVNISAYLLTYCVILLPSIIFMTAASIALNVLL
jgi:ABC-type transport system involved in multi-copper enzyme maturation permease subunit